MKIRILLTLSMLVSLFIQGCSNSSRLTDRATNQASTASTFISPSETAIANTPTSVVVPTMTTEMASTSTVESTAVIKPTCFTSLPALPENRIYPGKIVLVKYINDPGHAPQYYDKVSFYDFKTRQITPSLPEKIGDLKVSPNGLQFALSDATSNQIKVFSTDNQLIKTLPQGKNTYVFDPWLDKNRLVLVITEPMIAGSNWKYPRNVLAIDLLTGKQTPLPPNYPDIDRINARMIWDGFSTTKYDPSLTRVVYPAVIQSDDQGKTGEGYILWDLVQQKKLTQIVTGNFLNTPKWAPDGSKFIINSGYAGDGEFYVISRDGTINRVSRMNSGVQSTTDPGFSWSDSYNWSPDGMFIAFWRETSKDTISGIESTLSILDTGTGEITDTCVSAGISHEFPTLPVNFHPVWSSDGKYLVVMANQKENGGFEVMLIDKERKIASPISEDLHPFGWLADEKK